MHVVATAGHVDHGKSTLLKSLTGMEPDRWEEERRRGLTLDLGFVWTDLPSPDGSEDLTVAFVDVPGHERFVANMLAGAGAVRLALFVVAADDGWSAQSQEHLDILDLLGAAAAVVAVTKTALVDEDRALSVAADVERRLAGTKLAGAPVVFVDSVAGTGVDDLAATLARRLAAVGRPPDRGRPRLWIDRAFTVSGAGTVVTGTLSGGELTGGSEVAVLPEGRGVRIRGLQALGRDVDLAPPASRVAVNLAGVDRDALRRGDALVGVSGAGTARILDEWRATATFDAWVRALPDQEIGRTGAWHLHAGSADVTVSLHPVLNEPVTAGSPSYVRVVLDRPLPLVAGDRFVLRESGRQATLGGGIVLDPDPPVRPRGTDERLARSGELDRVLDAVRSDGGSDRRLASLVAAAGGTRPEGRARAAAGHSGALPDGVAAVGGHLVTSAARDRWTDATLAAAGRHHEQHPDSPGVERELLLEAAVAAGCPKMVAHALLDDLEAGERLHRAGSTYVLPRHAERAGEVRRQRRERLLDLLLAEPFSPPALDAAAEEAGLGHEEVTALVHTGRIVRCGRVAFARPAVDRAVDRLEELDREGGRFTTAEAREALGTTRKYAIPLLEYLDAAGVTEFDGQTRTVVGALDRRTGEPPRRTGEPPE